MSASQCISHGNQCYYVKSHCVSPTSIFKPTSRNEKLFVFDTSHKYLLNLYYCRYLTNSVMIWQMFTLLSCS